MPTQRNYIEIDAQAFEKWSADKTMEEVGKTFRRINQTYLSGDYEWIKSLPFVHKVYPRGKSKRVLG